MADTTKTNFLDYVGKALPSLFDNLGKIFGPKDYANYPVSNPYNGQYIPPQNNNPIDTSTIMIIAGIIVIFLVMKK